LRNRHIIINNKRELKINLYFSFVFIDFTKVRKLYYKENTNKSWEFMELGVEE